MSKEWLKLRDLRKRISTSFSRIFPKRTSKPPSGSVSYSSSEVVEPDPEQLDELQEELKRGKGIAEIIEVLKDIFREKGKAEIRLTNAQSEREYADAQRALIHAKAMLIPIEREEARRDKAAAAKLKLLNKAARASRRRKARIARYKAFIVLRSDIAGFFGRQFRSVGKGIKKPFQWVYGKYQRRSEKIRKAKLAGTYKSLWARVSVATNDYFQAHRKELGWLVSIVAIGSAFYVAPWQEIGAEASQALGIAWGWIVSAFEFLYQFFLANRTVILLILAAAVMAFGLWKLRQHWKKMDPAKKDAVKNKFRGVGRKLKKAFSYLREKISNLGYYFWKKIKSAASALTAKAKTKISSWWSTIPSKARFAKAAVGFTLALLLLVVGEINLSNREYGQALLFIGLIPICFNWRFNLVLGLQFGITVIFVALGLTIGL